MCVIPGGLTPYLQAGYIGIYKSFKDVLYMEINTKKDSDKVEYTQVDNPRMPSGSPIIGWVGTLHATISMESNSVQSGKSVVKGMKNTTASTLTSSKKV
ncbi:hypothetical protein F444_10959 [Phytophthora nicotianae P1976]|uniref:Uncharacterized protein n=1 Tax=Phytophthora nicotianae P1976 TaxID=1317066 RepID=A0A081A2G3_PHYNI|nr:hypothetical protein F444_10959 [Phytophthora nicotianae P1976]